MQAILQDPATTANVGANSALSDEIHELIETTLPSIVVVQQNRSGAGAGIIWSAEGLILTNAHVVGRKAPLVVLQDNSEYEARVLARDPDVDLALLAIDAQNLKPLPPAAVPVRVGELVFAFGHPWGQRNIVTHGIVSALLDAQNRRGEKLPIIRSDVSLAPGNSGGPLVNVRGEMVGVNAMIVGGDQSVSIAAPVIRDFVTRSMPSM
jgi:serine protease Do